MLDEVVGGVGHFSFGLGGADSARLFNASAVLVDSYDWIEHAATTYGRCPNGSGAFTETTASTKGAANACPPPMTFAPWPGGAAVQTADGLNVFGSNMSGLIYEGSGGPNSGVLWAVKNGPGTIYRLLFNGSIWTSDTTNSWSSGKALQYPGGLGNLDSEGITFAGSSSGGCTSRRSEITTTTESAATVFCASIRPRPARRSSRPTSGTSPPTCRPPARISGPKL